MAPDLCILSLYPVSVSLSHFTLGHCIYPLEHPNHHQIFLVPDAPPELFRINGNVLKPDAPSAKNLVHVTTSIDDEYFPVKRRLLRPCLALTKARVAQ
jgi:hypothetical protein